MAVAIDDLDRNILVVLQEDSSLPLDEIARRVGASKTPVWNRIRKMKASGLIRAEVALVDPEKLGLESCFFVLIRTSQHDADWLDRFLKAVQSRPEVIEAHRLAGEIDYILKVRVPNARAYDAFYRALIKEVSIFNVTSVLSMEEIKNTTALPVADRGGRVVKKKFLDTDHPMFRPLWVRLLVVAVCLGWAAFEFIDGSPFWGDALRRARRLRGVELLLAASPGPGDGPQE